MPDTRRPPKEAVARAQEPPALTPLPSIDDLPAGGDGYDRDGFATPSTPSAVTPSSRCSCACSRRPGAPRREPSGHALRMDALHLIRAAAEFADTLELDAQNAAAAQLRRTEEEVRRRQRELQEREAEVERYRAESDRQRAEMLNNARNEARQLLAQAQRDSAQELREAEARGQRLLEQSRHQATELTNSARAEVEQTLEWARAQAGSVLQRAQQGAEQLLSAAGLGQDALNEVVQAILGDVQASAERTRPAGVARPSVAAVARSGRARARPGRADRDAPEPPGDEG